MTNTKLFLAALSLLSLSAEANTPRSPVPPYEGEMTESSTITLLNFSAESAWDVLETALTDYDIVQSSPGGQFALVSCGGVAGNTFFIWGEEPQTRDGEYPRTLLHVTSECSGPNEPDILKIQDDILNAALDHTRATPTQRSSAHD
ncbi:MAG: hypothetical protein ABIR96_02680 [Bdellovibrionota bacterium]